MLSVTEDSSGAHDVLVGGSTAAGYARRAGAGRNTRDNLVLAAARSGLSRRDIPMALSLFAPTFVGADGTLGWQPTQARGDDYVDLRAEMDLLVALSNCPHPLDPAWPDPLPPDPLPPDLLPPDLLPPDLLPPNLLPPDLLPPVLLPPDLPPPDLPPPDLPPPDLLPPDLLPPVQVTRFVAAPDDICRTASAEALRGFENNAKLEWS